MMKMEAENTEIQLTDLMVAAEQTPGIQDVMAVYSYYQKLETTAAPVRMAMQRRSISTVSNGAYPVLSR